MTDDAPPWWKTAVFYQIYPRSFCDTTGNGVGDIDGIRSKLDHIAGLGVDALWISPMYPSPMADHGYDVADYCDIDPLFGDLDAFDTMLAEAHQRGLRVIIDWVPAHTSDQHPWFTEARSSRDNPKRDWYLWAEGDPDTPPTPWTAMFPAGPAWTWDDVSGAWYSRTFTPEQPDLNWSNPDVQDAMHATLRFWLDRGVDGFRMDVIHFIGRDPQRIIDGAESAHDPAQTHAHLRAIRRLIDGYDHDRVAVGEVFILDTEQVASHYGNDDELHLCHNFPPEFAPWTAAAWREQIETTTRTHDARNAWPTWILSNHDIPRMPTRYGAAAARAAAVVQLTLRGTPFVYAGDEFGLEDAVVPPDRAQDPAGFRDGCRAPIPWDRGPTHGWATADPWLPWPPQADDAHAVAQADDAASSLHLYRRLLDLRRSSPALQLGAQRPLQTDGEVLGWERSTDDDTSIVLVNFSDQPADQPLSGGGNWTVDIDSATDRSGQPYDGRLAPHAAVVLSAD